MKGPLNGILTLSLAETLPGPFATMLLAELGADVVLVERPDAGDPARSWPHVFASLAHNKRSICLNLKDSTDKKKFMRLVAAADVVLEGYAPGTVAKLGVDYDALRAVKPDLVYASISGFGQTGPYRDRPAHDVSTQAIAGLMADQARRAGSTPTIPWADLASGVFAALSIVTALYARDATGKGTYIDVSMADTLVSLMAPWIVPAINKGLALDISTGPAYGSFDCSDGRALTLSIAYEDNFWRSLCQAIGLPKQAELKFGARLMQSNALRAMVAQRIAVQPLTHWADLFDAQRIPWSPVNSLEEVAGDHHFLDRGLFDTLMNSAGKPEVYVRQPLLFSAFSRPPLKPAPGLGEHTEEILGSASEPQDGTKN
jgi:crotonobetainyl-CoA:carnitine CoA-transferase CaiB-like acyl-CoA transferase